MVLTSICILSAHSKIIELNGHHAHKFKCSSWGCKATICQFLDKKDAYSTRNMQKHIKACWGTDIMAIAETARNAEDVHTKIVKDILWNGNITVAFEQKHKVMYSPPTHKGWNKVWLISIFCQANNDSRVEGLKWFIEFLKTYSPFRSQKTKASDALWKQATLRFIYLLWIWSLMMLGLSMLILVRN